jgi:phospho-N-acetylmuramoyl-pentapeptide-transferase
VLYHLLYPLHTEVGGFNVVRYITFRTAVASLTALFLVLILGPWMIDRLQRLQIGQFIREEGPQAHQTKKGTPTMGGLLILAGIIIPTLLWANLTNRNVWIAVLSTIAFGAVGFMDDYLKVVKKQNLGLRGRSKLYFQLSFGFLIGTCIYVFSRVDPSTYSTRLIVPFFKNLLPDLGLLYIPFAVLFLTFASNAVNLTDGLDGLAIGTTLIAAAAFTVLTYVTGHAVFSRYLDLLFLPRMGELTIFCGAMVGASMGFLWWNCYPARIFMGDVGSLALGGALGTVAVLTKQEILLLSVGGVFIIEALSVILQVVFFKARGKRLFRMAPLHHHFELVGWKETQVVVRFWIVTMILVLIGFSTLKLR